jgi:hypothetical protein
LQEKQRNFSLATQLDKVSSFHGRLGEEDAIVTDDTDGHAVQASETSDLKSSNEKGQKKFEQASFLKLTQV